MARIAKPLSDTQISKTKPKEKEFTLHDGEGLHLLVKPNGSKLWRFRYEVDGVRKMISFGSYPVVTLARAREKRLEALRDLDRGILPVITNPLLISNIDSTEMIISFETVAREWHANYQHTWVDSHALHKIQRLEKEIFPYIGELAIHTIEPVQLLQALRRVANRGAVDTAHRLRFECGAIFRYGIATGRCKRDPASDLKGALPPVKNGHHAAPVEPKLLTPVLKAIDGYGGSLTVTAALKLQVLFFVRPGELRHAEWSEIDLEAGLWSIPEGKMKMKIAHIVPLCQQAVEILTELKPLTGRSKYVFPGGRSYHRPMSENAVNSALRIMGFEKDFITGHGFRAVARTILDEVLEFRPDIIEHQLAHAVKDPNGRAYNRTAHLPYRKKMMQRWADYLDELKG